MNILSNLKTLKYDIVNLKEGQYNIVKLNGQDNKSISYKLTNESDNNILNDLLECSAFATALLYLNENYILEIGKFKDIFEESGITVENYYSECNDLLNKNIEIVEEAGIPLIEIHGYKIFEGAGYILRGNGKKKIKESFEEKISDKEIEDKEIELDEEGTQTSDIASKVDQDMNKNKNITTSKKKHYDILLSGLDEGLDILNKGFLKNSKGQYQRGNYILVKEGDKYLAIHKDKLKESDDYYIKNNPELKQAMDDLYIKLENELNLKLGITLEGEPFGTYIQEWKKAKIPVNDNNTIKVDLTYTLPDGIYNSIYIMYTASIETSEGPGEVMNSGIYASSRTSIKDLASGSYSAWNNEKPEDIKQKNMTIDSFINTINNTIKEYK